MATDTNKGMVRLFDDFLGDTINLDLYTTNSDTGGTAFAVDVQVNGVIRGTVDTTDGDITNLFGADQWRPDSGGPLTIEVRAKGFTSLADGETYIGFSDAATDENPITLSTADAITTNASNVAGFAYTGAGTANWKAVSVNADADGSVITCNKIHTKADGTQSAVTTPVVGEWQTFKVVINSEGDADFYINGSWQGTELLAVAPTTTLIPAVALQSGGTARSLDVDYIDVVSGRRAAA
jgi:hypothetical protein